MSIEIPIDFVPFVRRLVDSRRFLSEEDVVLEGLRMLHAREILRAEVEKGFEDLDAGRSEQAGIVFDRIRASIADK